MQSTVLAQSRSSELGDTQKAYFVLSPCKQSLTLRIPPPLQTTVCNFEYLHFSHLHYSLSQFRGSIGLMPGSACSSA